MKTYRLSAAGRRSTLVLILSALLLAAFALWSLISSVQTNYAQIQSLSMGHVLPALLMLILLVATPFLIWNLLEEWAATYRTDADGLSFESLGISIHVPWSVVVGLRPADDDNDDPLDTILFNQDVGAQIPNPILRFLHRQTYGARSLPVYPGLEARSELLAAIRSAIPA
ncbi:hypothetical protein OSCT_0842 [Oscillochloris trichoides DG-6]|uniref:Uncharacterized protein n=1 Tax=Oscillochloris trichoides DG-6 TaxID=765420 RepID=E1IBZ1_9CHLR|nr:hypothetical protein [Oscillochloris trichoides]EFO81319.1 hypothetical protein OSCT_0842 [Oscillochloris trichoides DG-6]